LADSVEKLDFTTARKLLGIYRLPGARITDRLCRSEVRQAGFSCDFCYPLVTTVRNAAQIANEIVALFKPEFFNTIGRKRPVIFVILVAFERPLWRKADIPLLFCSGVTSTLIT